MHDWKTCNDWIQTVIKMNIIRMSTFTWKPEIMVSENDWSSLNTNGKEHNYEGVRIPTTVVWNPGPGIRNQKHGTDAIRGRALFEALPSASLRYCNCALVFWWGSGYRTWTELLSASGILSFWEGSNKIQRALHFSLVCNVSHGHT